LNLNRSRRSCTQHISCIRLSVWNHQVSVAAAAHLHTPRYKRLAPFVPALAIQVGQQHPAVAPQAIYDLTTTAAAPAAAAAAANRAAVPALAV
jgi:hypothetical protein